MTATSLALALQLIAELSVVVDLAVEHHGDRPVLVVDRLVAAGQIDDAQPAHPQCKSRRPRIAGKKPFFIRTAMVHRRGHRPYARLSVCAARSERDAAYTAHATV